MKLFAYIIPACFFLSFFGIGDDTIGEFQKHTTIPITEFNEIAIPIFDIEAPPDIQSTGKRTIVYDSLYPNLFLVNFDAPSTSIMIRAADPLNNRYEMSFAKKGGQFVILTAMPVTNAPLDRPVFSVPFYNSACFNSGKWHFSVFIDGKTVSAHEQTIDITMSDITIMLNSKDTPNPFSVKVIRNSLKQKQEMMIYGDMRQKKNRKLKLGLYRFTDKRNPDNETILEPVIGTFITTDKYGKFAVVFKIGNKFPKGSYYVCTGENAVEAHLFSGYFSVK